METKRRLKKIGGSVALFIPPEMLEELLLEPGAEVEVTSEEGSIHVRRAVASPPDVLIEFARSASRSNTKRH